MSLLDALARFAIPSLVVTRSTYAAPINGKYAAPTPTTLTLTDAVVTPFSGQLNALPEGVNTSDTKVIYTATQLLDAKDGRLPDSLSIDGEDYLVFRVDGPWVIPSSTHYRAYAARRRLP